MLIKLHAAVVFSVSIILSGCNATPETFSEFENNFNKNHSGLEQLRSEGFHINFKRMSHYRGGTHFQPKKYVGSSFVDFRFSFQNGYQKTTRDLVNLKLLDMPLSSCHDGYFGSKELVCGDNPYEITNLELYRNNLSESLHRYENFFKAVYMYLDQIDSKLSTLNPDDKKRWLTALIEMNSGGHTRKELLSILKVHAEQDSSQFLNLVAENEKRKHKISLQAEKNRLEQQQKERERLANLQYQREQEERKQQGIARAKKLINDPNMIGHKFCRDGELQYIGLVNYVGSAKWGSLTEKGQMQATLEGLSPDKKMAKLRAIGYATSGTLQYKNDTTPSLDGLSIPSGQVFWDNKNHWYSCPN